MLGADVPPLPLVCRRRDVEPGDGVSVPHPVRGQEAGEERREAAVLQEQSASL